MCGIVGLIRFARLDSNADVVVKAMTDRLAHRGPDADGAWSDPNGRVFLGHRRLSIQDLSVTGSQPMFSDDGRFVFLFNGEIYNCLELRAEFIAGGHVFRGTSDTEVLLAGFVRWGVTRTLERCVGMFAFALYDREAGSLYLARDRMGEKPLYYGWCGTDLVFASELKALKSHPQWKGTISPVAVDAYFRYSCVPAPLSIYTGIRKLMPASVLELRLNELPCGALPEPQPYWSILTQVLAGQAAPFTGSEKDATDELDFLLRQAVRQQMIADVPLGAFLSGGIDSSTVVALMQAQSTGKVQTFTIGFSEQGFDEAIQAREIARRLGTDHKELYIMAGQVQETIARLPSIYDEPFADSSQIPTFLVSKLARQHVTVSLSGDGGDELFGGYVRYQIALKVWKNVGRFPQAFRSRLKQLITAVPVEHWESLLGGVMARLGGLEWDHRTGDRLHKLADILDQPDLGRLSHTIGIKNRNLLRADFRRPTVELDMSRAVREDLVGIADPLEKLTYLDLISYLPDDILTKVDRATMACSLEGRMPLLDHRVVEFSCRLPSHMKLRDGQGKWLLRQVQGRYLPAEMFGGNKKGFAVPMEYWLRGPLHEWAQAILQPERLRRSGYVDPEVAARYWQEHQSGLRPRHNELWDILTFESWLAAQ